MDRKYQTYVATLKLAMRPGTLGEAQAAWEAAERLESKYGYTRPGWAYKATQAKPDAAQGFAEGFNTKDMKTWLIKFDFQYIIKDLMHIGKLKLEKCKKNGQTVYKFYGTKNQVQFLVDLYKYYIDIERIWKKEYNAYCGNQKGFRTVVKQVLYDDGHFYSGFKKMIYFDREYFKDELEKMMKQVR